MLDESVKSDLEKTVLEWKGWSVENLARKTLAYIEQLEKLVPRWISVKEMLPEKGDNVLISLCGCNVKQAVYRGDGVFESAYADTYHSTGTGSIVLTHWMPTPEPKKEDT